MCHEKGPMERWKEGSVNSRNCPTRDCATLHRHTSKVAAYPGTDPSHFPALSKTISKLHPKITKNDE